MLIEAWQGMSICKRGQPEQHLPGYLLKATLLLQR